jgi:hypothetical protein
MMAFPPHQLPRGGANDGVDDLGLVHFFCIAEEANWQTSRVR